MPERPPRLPEAFRRTVTQMTLLRLPAIALLALAAPAYAQEVTPEQRAAPSAGSRPYPLLPSTTDITPDGQGMVRASSQTLALEEGGEWWLVRVEDPQQAAVLTQADPEFAGVSVPRATMTSLP